MKVRVVDPERKTSVDPGSGQAVVGRLAIVRYKERPLLRNSLTVGLKVLGKGFQGHSGIPGMRGSCRRGWWIHHTWLQEA
jgi:hypothetical protein